MLIEVLVDATTVADGTGLPHYLAIPLFLLIGVMATFWYWRKGK